MEALSNCMNVPMSNLLIRGQKIRTIDLTNDINKTDKLINTFFDENKQRKLEKLIKYAEKYNETHPYKRDPLTFIPLEKFKSEITFIDKLIELLVICLWEREVEFPSELSFGEPYDEILKGWSLTNDDNEPYNRIYMNDKNLVYLILTHSDLARQFLYYSLDIAMDEKHCMSISKSNEKNLTELNDILNWLNKSPVINKRDFLMQSKKYTPFDLCFLVFETEMRNITSKKLYYGFLEELILSEVTLSN